MSEVATVSGVQVEEQDYDNFQHIKQELLSTPMYLCPERAYLITEYFKHHDDASEPMIVRKARALAYLLKNKSVHIYPYELIVGNLGRHRKSAIIQPELAGVFMSEELLWIDKRKTTPFLMSWADRMKLLFRVFPYWLTRNLLVRAFFPRIPKLVGYALEQLNPPFYILNEVGGIGHFPPNYERMLRHGVTGYLESMEGKEGDFHAAARVACEGLVNFARRLSQEAERLAAEEADAARGEELQEIARICKKVPYEPAETFHEAVQCLWLTHMAVCLEGINSAVCLGRMDQYLYPYYQHDLEEGRITPERAREILLCFSAKTTEHAYLLSQRTSEYYGGLQAAQTVIVGGVDREGRDAVNDLTYILLDVMENYGLKEPNYQARIHTGSPEGYVRRAADVARKSMVMPSFFNDDVVIDSLASRGYPLEESRNYVMVGCVEPSIPGKSFFSTNASLYNIPICLELALNRGRRFGGRRRVGAATPPPESFTGMDQVIEAFRLQLEHVIARLITDLQVMEKGNRDFHPTPLSSMLIDGCIESGKDITEGGALYNASGILGIGVADTADSLAALEEVVFRQKKYSMAQVVEALRSNFESHPAIQAELLNAPKYGNDDPLPDGYASQVVEILHSVITSYRNTRGGTYVPGNASSTAHVAFGKHVKALPSGRRAGEPLAVSLGPANGVARLGPTAILNSVASIESRLIPMGYAANLRFDPHILSGDRGLEILTGLIQGYFASGGLHMQLNVVDHELLQDARRNPGKYPGLVVRVSGFCSYFDDLPDSTKEEIIARTRLEV